MVTVLLLVVGSRHSVGSSYGQARGPLTRIELQSQTVYAKTSASAQHGTMREWMVRDIGKKRRDAGVDCRDEEQVDDRAKLYPPRDSGRPKPHSESAIRETSDRRRVEGNTIGRAKQHCKDSGK